MDQHIEDLPEARTSKPKGVTFDPTLYQSGDEEESHKKQS